MKPTPWPTGSDAVRQDHLERAVQSRWPLRRAPGPTTARYGPTPGPHVLTYNLAVLVRALHRHGDGRTGGEGILWRTRPAKVRLRSDSINRDDLCPGDLVTPRAGWTWELVGEVLASAAVVSQLQEGGDGASALPTRTVELLTLRDTSRRVAAIYQAIDMGKAQLLQMLKAQSLGGPPGSAKGGE